MKSKNKVWSDFPNISGQWGGNHEWSLTFRVGVSHSSCSGSDNFSRGITKGKYRTGLFGKWHLRYSGRSELSLLNDVPNIEEQKANLKALRNYFEIEKRRRSELSLLNDLSGAGNFVSSLELSLLNDVPNIPDIHR